MSPSVFNPSSSSCLSPFHLELCRCFKAISYVIMPFHTIAMCKKVAHVVADSCNKKILTCYISRCSAKTVKIKLMVFLFMLYRVVEPKCVEFSQSLLEVILTY